MSEFTPGPWKQANEYPNAGWLDEMVGADGTHVVCFGHDYDDFGMFGHPELPDPNHFSQDEWDAAIGVAAANVSLIAAAPDLYEALVRVVDSAGGFDWGDAVDIAHVALAKARGDTEEAP